ncbi:MAG: hypothetical protein AB1478_10030 [Nitrospirota bacterium]
MIKNIFVLSVVLELYLFYSSLKILGVFGILIAVLKFEQIFGANNYANSKGNRKRIHGEAKKKAKA